jgi:hypothetical protein
LVRQMSRINDSEKAPLPAPIRLILMSIRRSSGKENGFGWIGSQRVETTRRNQDDWGSPYILSKRTIKVKLFGRINN